MKKILLLIILLFLCACTTKNNDPVKPEPEPDPVNNKELSKAYVETMEAYETLEIAFLGCINDLERERAVIDNYLKAFPMYSFINELKDDIVYQKDNIVYGNVYLIIPSKNTDIAIGKPSFQDHTMTDIYFKQEDCLPFIYIEENNTMTPQSIIVHNRDNDYDFLYTGFLNGQLRTAFHMGTVDITMYDHFTSSDIPFMEQAIFDTLVYEVPGVMDNLNNGYTLDKMDEIFYNDKAYALYIMHDQNFDPQMYYGVNIDNNKTSVIQTKDIFVEEFEIVLEK